MKTKKKKKKTNQQSNPYEVTLSHNCRNSPPSLGPLPGSLPKLSSHCNVRAGWRALSCFAGLIQSFCSLKRVPRARPRIGNVQIAAEAIGEYTIPTIPSHYQITITITQQNHILCWGRSIGAVARCLPLIRPPQVQSPASKSFHRKTTSGLLFVDHSKNYILVLGLGLRKSTATGSEFGSGWEWWEYILRWAQRRFRNF